MPAVSLYVLRIQLDLQGDARPRPVGPYETNLENAAKIRQDWSIGRKDPAATQALLAVIRQATPEAASAEVVKGIGEPSFGEKLRSQGIEITPGGRKELDKFRATERKRFGEIIKVNGVKIE